MINKKIMAGKPGAVHQIRQRLTAFNPPLEQCCNSRLLGGSQRLIPGNVVAAGIQVTGFEHQPGRLIKSIIGAVTKEQVRRIEGIGGLVNLLLQTDTHQNAAQAIPRAPRAPRRSSRPRSNRASTVGGLCPSGR